MIVDYTFYANDFYGDIIPDTSFPKWESRAADELNRITAARVLSLKEYPAGVKKAVCALADVLYQIDTASKQCGVSQDGKGKLIKSVSSGSESVSYDTGKNLIYTALSDQGAQDKLLYDTAKRYLTGVTDDNGVCLLYRG